jgi:LysR family glycine cleavage system transcriptional activator
MNLPPLHLLRTFDVAARHLSFKKAAAELHVTPSAVSHQIKQLEDLLGLPLFLRVNRGLRLTPAGQFYAEKVGAGMDQLQRATQSLSQRFGRPVLRASILPFMAAELVIPALESFQQQHPEIELRIETSVQNADFDSGEVDVAIRFGLGDWPGLVSEKLSDIIGSPVCSPAYAREHDLSSLQDIRRCKLIGLPADARDAWKLLVEKAQLADFTPQHTLTVDSLLAASRAAEQGLGLGIGVFPLMSPLVDSGRLVTPFNIWVPVPEGYYLVWRSEDRERADIRAFCQWMREQFGNLPLPHGLEVSEIHLS